MGIKPHLSYMELTYSLEVDVSRRVRYMSRMSRSTKPFLTVVLDPELKAAIERAARAQHQAASEWLRQAALKALREQGGVIKTAADPPAET